MTNDLASTAAQSLNRDFMVGLRLARVGGFEPAIALSPDELPVYQRRFAMLFADDATMRRGGIGRVTRAVNAQGEAVALKQLILPTRDEFDDDAAYEALVAKFKAAFREEYECHRALSGLKGFPRLYGWGEVDGVPAIVMEWVEGETLARLRPRLAVDDAGRLSPLVAARLGRDLFDLLCRMNLVGGLCPSRYLACQYYGSHGAPAARPTTCRGHVRFVPHRLWLVTGARARLCGGGNRR